MGPSATGHWLGILSQGWKQDMNVRWVRQEATL